MREDSSHGALALAAMGLLLALIMASIILAPCVAAEVTAEAASASGTDWWSWFMQYGPMIVQICIIIALMFNVWQRNVVKSAICAGACIVTFVLGW